MTSRSHNTQAGEPDGHRRTGGGRNPEQSQQQSGETRPEGGGRDREGRKGGDDPENR